MSSGNSVGMTAGGAGLDRWLFYFEGRAVADDQGDATAAVRYLESAAPDIEREIVREIRQALPGELSAEVDIRFAAGSVIWFGMVSVTAVDSGLASAARSEGFLLMLEKLVCYAIDHVVQEYASHFGFYGFRTRPRGMPHVRDAAPTAEPERRVDLAAIEARLDGLRRMLRWGVAALALLICILVLGLAWVRGVRASSGPIGEPVSTGLAEPAPRGPSSPFQVVVPPSLPHPSAVAALSAARIAARRGGHPMSRRESLYSKYPDYSVELETGSARFVARLGGEVVAESVRALIVRETNLDPVIYFPREDVQMALLARTEHETFCPFKGEASYWTIRAGGQEEENVVWGYEDPFEQVAGLKDYLSFYTDRLEVGPVS